MKKTFLLSHLELFLTWQWFSSFVCDVHFNSMRYDKVYFSFFVDFFFITLFLWYKKFFITQYEYMKSYVHTTQLRNTKKIFFLFLINRIFLCFFEFSSLFSCYLYANFMRFYFCLSSLLLNKKNTQQGNERNFYRLLVFYS